MPDEGDLGASEARLHPRQHNRGIMNGEVGIRDNPAQLFHEPRGGRDREDFTGKAKFNESSSGTGGGDEVADV